MNGPQNPRRAGVQRLVIPWVYRHRRAVGAMHVVGGTAGVVAGGICLAYDADGWAAVFLAIGAANYAGAVWHLTSAGPPPARA